ncbi:MAG: hypothetical protein GYA24_03420 [Candidatus Lokiarchaeota archaeon]|nr:hypothetical protein [Candidatus Lokiarchaeota archaeon]
MFETLGPGDPLAVTMPVGLYQPVPPASPPARRYGLSLRLPIKIDYFPGIGATGARRLGNFDKEHARRVEYGMFDYISPGETVTIGLADIILVIDQPGINGAGSMVLPVKWY